MEDGWGMLKRFQILFPEIQPRPAQSSILLLLFGIGEMGKLPLLYSVYATISALMMSYLVTSYVSLRIASVCSHFSPIHAIGRRFEHVPRYVNPQMNNLHSRLFLFTMEIFRWPLISGGASESVS